MKPMFKTGMIVSLTIDGKKVKKGMIFIEDNAVFLFNDKYDGTTPYHAKDMRGYKYSTYLGDITDSSLSKKYKMVFHKKTVADPLVKGEVLIKDGKEYTIVETFGDMIFLSKEGNPDSYDKAINSKESAINGYKLKGGSKEIPVFTINELTEIVGQEFYISGTALVNEADLRDGLKVTCRLGEIPVKDAELRKSGDKWYIANNVGGTLTGFKKDVDYECLWQLNLYELEHNEHQLKIK